MEEIPRVATTEVYRNKWMAVHEDTIIHTDGSRGLYSVVEKPDSSLIIPAGENGFHLVSQYRYPAKGRFLEFPQGAWEDDPHIDPVTVAHGELEEETGLRAQTLRRLGTLHEAYGFCTQRCHVFLATGLSEGTARPSVEEGTLRRRHVPFAEFPRLVADGQITDGVTVAAYGLLLLDQGATITSVR